MKFISSTLYLDSNDLVSCGISYNTITKASQRGSNNWKFIEDPADKKRLLCDYQKLSDKYKELVQKKFGNPYEYIAKQPIKDLITTDFKAQQFYTSFSFPDGKKLSMPQIDKYSKAASFLNMMIACIDKPMFVKKELGLPIIKFYDSCKEIIKADDISLPKCYKRLYEKILDYREIGYTCIIDRRAELANNTKVKTELATQVLLKLISKPHVDDVTISRAYNTWAVANDHKPITDATVGNYRRQFAPLLTNEKQGAKKWFDKFGKVVKGRRPSCPMALWEHDDNDLDLYYIKDKKNKLGKTNVFYYGRFVVAVVIDAYNDYIVGWSWAEAYTKDLIKAAYLDAVYHINELTGGWYLPHQIRSDRFGLDRNLSNDLAQFYQKIATYTPAKAQSARGKYIEQSFGRKWHQVLCQYPNYAGHNITSRAGINMELIETNKRMFPNAIEAPFEIAEFINKMRNLQQVEDGPSKQEAWIEGFNNSDIAKEKSIGLEQMLLTFGSLHKFNNQITDNKVQITSRGLEVTINKHFHEYDIPDEIYMQVVGKRVHIIYDPYNPNHILVTDGERLRFIAEKLTEEMKQPRALVDYKEGDRTRLNNNLRAMSEHVQGFTEAKDKRDNLLQLHRIDTDGLLQSGMLIKGQKQHAELMYQNNLLTGNDLIEDAISNM